MRDKPWPYEANLSVTTTQQELILPGPNDPSLLGVRWEAISTDEGKVAGATEQTIQLSVVPAEQTDAAGGSTLQTPYAAVLDGPGGGLVVRGNALPLSFIARPGESVSVFYKAANAVTARLRIQRTKLYDRKWLPMIQGGNA